MIYLGNLPIGIANNKGLMTYIVSASNIFYYGNNTSMPKPTVPSKVVLDLPACLNISSMFAQYIKSDAYALPIQEASITLYNPVIATNFARRNSKLKKIIFPNGIIITSAYYDFINDSIVESIIGPIGFNNPTDYTTTKNAFNVSTLKDIEFIPNQIIYDISFTNTDILTDDSIVSICNGLNETVADKTLTMSSTVKTKMNNMNGIVTIPSGELYHIFTLDENGTTTLSNFITNIKGWTVG